MPVAVQTEPPPERSPIELTFHSAGHTLTQVFRSGVIAIYARALPSRPPHEYELVVFQNRSEQTLPNGQRISAGLGYPRNGEWGKCAWSLPARERDLVFELARRMTKIPGPYGKWMREMLKFYRDHGRLPNSEETL